MAKSSAVAKQKRREHLIQIKREKREQLKKVVRSLTATEEEKEQARRQLNALPKNSSPIRSRNRCQLTGRPRGYLRKFKLSRICFREMANKGLLPGVFKASW